MPDPPWEKLLEPPWPALDPFLNTPTVQWVKGELRIAWDGAAEGSSVPDEVFDPDNPREDADGKKLVPGFALGESRVRGYLCGGYTSALIDMTQEGLLLDALRRWDDAERPGPVHPMTLACLLVSPPPHDWLLVAVNPLDEWEEQAQRIKHQFRFWREARKRAPVGARRRPPKRGKLELGKKVLAFTLFHHLGMKGESLAVCLPRTDPRAIREHLKTVRERLHAGLQRRAEQVLGAAGEAFSRASAGDRPGPAYPDQIKIRRIVGSWYASIPPTCRLKPPR